MSKAEIQIRGLDEFRARILGGVPGIKSGVKAATVHVAGKAQIYPPETMANQPKIYQRGGNNTWYQRGYGSKRATPSGKVWGKGSSEQLQQQWAKGIRFENDGLTGIVGNKVSYAPYVMGERNVQATALKGIGWKSVEDIADEERDTVLNFIKENIDRALG